MYQRDLAYLIGKSAEYVSHLEHGRAIPTVFETVLFKLLFGTRFDDLWPRLYEEHRTVLEDRLKRLMVHLERAHLKPGKEDRRASSIQLRLEILLGELPEQHE